MRSSLRDLLNQLVQRGWAKLDVQPGVPRPAPPGPWWTIDLGTDVTTVTLHPWREGLLELTITVLADDDNVTGGRLGPGDQCRRRTALSAHHGQRPQAKRRRPSLKLAKLTLSRWEPAAASLWLSFQTLRLRRRARRPPRSTASPPGRAPIR